VSIEIITLQKYTIVLGNYNETAQGLGEERWSVWHKHEDTVIFERTVRKIIGKYFSWCFWVIGKFHFD